jgi:ATP-binding cassette subfamily B protein
VDPSVQLWNRSLPDNLRYGAPPEAPPITDVVAASNLREIHDRLGHEPLGEGGALLSGGEGQRVRFGRGLARAHARLVLLDEPFRGLERPVRASLLATARQRWRKTTLLCVTHDIGETTGFDRVLVVAGGRIAEQGTPAELAAAPGSRYRAMLAAEEETAALLRTPEWRRFRLDDGRLTEQVRA